MKSHTNLFLVNLSLADLGLAIFNCIPSFLSMRDGVWLLGSAICKISQFR